MAAVAKAIMNHSDKVAAEGGINSRMVNDIS